MERMGCELERQSRGARLTIRQQSKNRQSHISDQQFAVTEVRTSTGGIGKRSGKESDNFKIDSALTEPFSFPHLLAQVAGPAPDVFPPLSTTRDSLRQRIQGEWEFFCRCFNFGSLEGVGPQTPPQN